MSGCYHIRSKTMNIAQAVERMRQVIRRQHKALATEDCYIFWLRRYMAALHQMPANLTSEKKLEQFLTDLALRCDVAASTQNQALHAILYFYKFVLEQPLANVDALRATRPVHERYAPTVTETQALLQTIPNQGGYPTNLVARLLYGCGLRVSEPLNLRIKDVDLERRRLCIRGAKGGNDRVVNLPQSIIPELRQQMQLARIVWERDRHNRTPLMLPHRLAVKYPEYQFSWPWAWLFPAHNPCRDPRSGKIVRYRMHEVNVQRAVKYARRKLDISVLPHCLRHAYASHCLDRGTNPRAIQKSMGHKSLETTMGYTHAEALSVCSPLDALPVILPPLKRGSVPSMAGNLATRKAEAPSRNSVPPTHFPSPTLASPRRFPVTNAGNLPDNPGARRPASMPRPFTRATILNQSRAWSQNRRERSPWDKRWTPITNSPTHSDGPYLSGHRRPDGPMNWSKPIRSETNRSPAAGSGR
jgi:integron integrase